MSPAEKKVLLDKLKKVKKELKNGNQKVFESLSKQIKEELL